MKSPKLQKNIISYVAGLAKLNPTKKDALELKKQVESTIDYISKLSEIDTNGVKMTPQVTDLKNVFRDDVIDSKRLLSQEEALSNAKRKHKGFFVVKGVFEE